MPEGRKMLQSSPASAGAGDISERELSRERYNLLTPPARSQRTHVKKQQFSTPVNKFTAKVSPSTNLSRLRTCLDELTQTPARPAKIGPKAVSMEDLTPTKRVKKEVVLNSKKNKLPLLTLPPLHGAAERAAARVGVFMLVACWRRKRDEVRCLRKTLEFQVSSSERLRIQVCALKSLLDSDNAKVRLAIRELERLKQLLRDKEMEKTVLEKEKYALEQDICAAEDRVSEMSIGWRNCRNELECVRNALVCEQNAAAVVKRRCDNAEQKIACLEEESARRAGALAALRRDLGGKQRREKEARERAERECSELSAEAARNAQEAQELSARVAALSAELELMRRRWLPPPFYRLAGAARAWLQPKKISDALLWTLVPARHGC